MKASAAVLKKWAKIYNDDLKLFKPSDWGHIKELCSQLDYEELPDDAGFFAWIVVNDFDCKKRMSVVILYCRPEKRGLYLRYMFRRLEEIAKQEGVVELAIGHSISGYKEEKHDKMLEYFGYKPSVYSKRF